MPRFFNARSSPIVKVVFPLPEVAPLYKQLWLHLFNLYFKSGANIK